MRRVRIVADGCTVRVVSGADNRLIQTKVSVGRRSGELIAVTSGLEASTRIVNTGVGFLSDGDTVRVVSSATPSK